MTTGPLPLTAIVLTKDEAPVIERTITALSVFDQVLVVDSNSADGTGRLARELGAEVVSFDWNKQYPKKKQWSMERPEVRHDWILFVDADELPDEACIVALRDFFESGLCSRYSCGEIDVRYWFLGRELRHGHRVRKRALVNRRLSWFPVVDDLDVARMWEVEGHYQPQSEGAVASLGGSLLHIDVDPLFDYFSRHNRYSDWEAHLRIGERSRVVDGSRTKGGRIFSKLPAKPLVFFAYSYIVRRGWLDGREGFHYALFQAFYYWQISLKERELRRRHLL